MSRHAFNRRIHLVCEIITKSLFARFVIINRIEKLLSGFSVKRVIHEVNRFQTSSNTS